MWPHTIFITLIACKFKHKEKRQKIKSCEIKAIDNCSFESRGNEMSKAITEQKLIIFQNSSIWTFIYIEEISTFTMEQIS